MSNGYGYGGGEGFGGGRGGGMGKGMGRGRGRGRGQGMGRERGSGRGIGRGQRFVPLAGSSLPAPEPRDAAKQAQALKAQAQDMMDQLGRHHPKDRQDRSDQRQRIGADRTTI